VAAEKIDADAGRRRNPRLADGPVIRDRFVEEDRIQQLIACAQLRRRRGDFASARVGADQRRQRHTEIRGDRTCWFEEPLFDAERALLADLEQLRLELIEETYLGLFELELHYAHYPPGAGYVRHIDQLEGRDHRQVSLILYLNETWAAGAGGELRMFDAGGGFRDIQPLAGRLVYFLTAGCEHAVLETHIDRLSISGWFRSRGPNHGPDS
jgi:SM-20-related protein